MRHRRLGQTGIEVPIIGQGSWLLDTFDRGDVIRTLRRGVELGLTHIDTAYEYGLGAVESLIGEALGDVRDQLFITTKILPSVATYEGTIAACEASLQRLGTDHVDLLLLHWPESPSLGKTIEAFEHLVEVGKTRAYGMSNMDCDKLREAIDLSNGNLACNQVIYNLQMRHVEHALLPLCREHGITLIGYSPFGDHSTPSTLFGPTLLRGGGLLEAIADEHGVSPRNVVLAYLLRNDGVLVIPKCERVEFVEDNARAGDLVLTDANIAAIEAQFGLPDETAVPWANPPFN